MNIIEVGIKIKFNLIYLFSSNLLNIINDFISGH